MSEYIDKKALLDEICRDNCERSYDGTCHNCRMTETIADFPAADVQPVVHGQWMPNKSTRESWMCSVCGNEICGYDTSPAEYGENFCSHCGARMDGEQG